MSNLPPSSTDTITTTKDIYAISTPRVTIRFCTQCKWNLRAAYFAQELLSTFGTDIGEVSLVPVTGGTFTISLFTSSSDTSASPPPQEQKGVEAGDGASLSEVSTYIGGEGTENGETMDGKGEYFVQSTKMDGEIVDEYLIWDRTRDKGFPETKELKNRVRNVIDPDRDMGHVDRALKKGKEKGSGSQNGDAARGENETVAQREKNVSGASGGGSTGAGVDGGNTKVSGSRQKGQHACLSGATLPEDCEECKEAVQEMLGNALKLTS